MNSRRVSDKPRLTAFVAAFYLAAVILLSPLASGYAWVSGGHAGESHVHRHHLMEKLVPYSHHHAVIPTSAAERAAPAGDGSDSVILHGVAAFALPAVMAPAFIPELASFFDSATAALVAAAVAALVLTHYTKSAVLNSIRPQTDIAPPDRPPSA